MWAFNSVLSKIFEFLFLPFHNMSPWIGMLLISFLTALFMLSIFRFISNQQGIRKVKNKIKAYLLELFLFRDSFGHSLKAQGNLLRYNLKYLSYTIKPLMVMIIPLILILIQLNLWFGYQSLSPGQKAIVKVKLEEDSYPLDFDFFLESSSGLDIETPQLRIEEEREIDWRICAKAEGIHDLTLTVNGQQLTKKVAIAQKPFHRISPLRVRRNFINELFNPGEPPYKGTLPIKSIEVTYPSKAMNLFGWDIPQIWDIPPWLIVYFALSIILGFAFKGVFKVEI